MTFDAGDTLIHWVVPQTERFAHLCARAGIALPPERAGAAARAQETRAHALWDAADRGSVRWWCAIDRAGLEAAGVRGDLAAMARRIYEAAAAQPPAWVPDPDVPAVLEALRARSLRLGVVSNWDGSLQTVLGELGLLPHLDFVADSAVIGSRKPDAAIYRAAARALGVPPEACLHVGDTPWTDEAVADRVGARGVLYDPLDVAPARSGRTKITRLLQVLDLVGR